MESPIIGDLIARQFPAEIYINKISFLHAPPTARARALWLLAWRRKTKKKKKTRKRKPLKTAAAATQKGNGMTSISCWELGHERHERHDERIYIYIYVLADEEVSYLAKKKKKARTTYKYRQQ